MIRVIDLLYMVFFLFCAPHERFKNGLLIIRQIRQNILHFGSCGVIFVHVYSKKRNRSGSFSIQIVQKHNRSNRVIKTVGIAQTKREEELLLLLAKIKIGAA